MGNLSSSSAPKTTQKAGKRSGLARPNDDERYRAARLRRALTHNLKESRKENRLLQEGGTHLHTPRLPAQEEALEEPQKVDVTRHVRHPLDHRFNFAAHSAQIRQLAEALDLERRTAAALRVQTRWRIKKGRLAAMLKRRAQKARKAAERMEAPRLPASNLHKLLNAEGAGSVAKHVPPTISADAEDIDQYIKRHIRRRNMMERRMARLARMATRTKKT